MSTPIYRLKVALRGIRPTIWRRLEVPADLTLFELHRAIQGAVGWTDSHLHQFLHRGTCYGAPDHEFGMPIVSERRTSPRLSEIADTAPCLRHFEGSSELEFSPIVDLCNLVCCLKFGDTGSTIRTSVVPNS